MFSSGIQLLMRNDEKDFLLSATTLLRISSNIIKYPKDAKYRSIRIDSQAFQAKLLPFDGSIQCLLEMGFQEDGDKFTLFVEQCLDDVRIINGQLNSAIVSKRQPISKEILESQEGVLNRIKSHHQHTTCFEDAETQRAAKILIPIQILYEKASKRSAKMPNSQKNPTNFYHCLLLELLAWFKRDFFTWTDAPNCSNCPDSAKVISIGMLTPSTEDLKWGAGRVEGYTCTGCSSTLRFPRYNNPLKLLESRTGRCGEWANCFTLMCRAVGLEARHVLDWTDHVWTEVYIPAWSRWVHCDPCENICDKPLIYEQGWKKKLALIVSANVEQVVDVTRRYSFNTADVDQRRSAMFDADWLTKSIESINTSIKRRLSISRKNELEKRLQKEEEELSSTKDPRSMEYGGRTSGSLEWRLGRGETGGNTTPSSDGIVTLSPIQPTVTELENLRIKIEYSCKNDEYTRCSNNNEMLDGWETLVYKHQDIFRNEEFDWKMVYLSRKEGSKCGMLCWRIELPDKYAVNSIELKVNYQAFESGKVGCLLSSDKTCHAILSGESTSFADEYSGAKSVSIRVFLKGGEGECAWQKAQLFRESSKTAEATQPFILNMSLRKT